MIWSSSGLDTVWEFLLSLCPEGHNCGSGFSSWVEE